MKLLTLNFNLRLFILLTIGFIGFTVIGTLSHECGHAIAARYFGIKARVAYAYTSFEQEGSDREFIRFTWKKYRRQILGKQPYPGKERWDKINDGMHAKFEKSGPWILLGGPLQTMLTGTLGFIVLLVLRRRYFKSERLSFGLWLVIYFALFWLRQTTNLLVGIGYYLTRPVYRGRSDEFGIARLLHLPHWSFLIVTGIIGLILLAIILFRFVPLKQRLTFMAAGLAGGITGYLSWLVWFGKFILP